MPVSKSISVVAASMLALMVCQFGCGHSNSGLLEIFKTDALVRAAGSSQGASIQRGDKTMMLDVNPEKALGCYNDFDIRLASGSCEQFLTNYQAQVKTILQSKGARIVGYEPPPSGFSAEEGNFRYLYTWSKKNGIVRVTWGTHATNHYEIAVVFSEGRGPLW